jgi:hypothetical protein
VADVSDASAPIASPALSPAQQRTLDVLRRSSEPLVFDDAIIDDLISTAATALAELSARLQGQQLWVSKGFLTRVHGCEVHHLAPDEFAWKPSTAAGFVAHKAIELSMNWRGGDPHPAIVVDEALARLVDQADSRGTYIAGLTDGEWAELRSRAVDRTTKFLQDFPPIPVSSHPVLEAAVKWRPPGTIEFSGKVDLVIGRPSGNEARLLIIDFKSGNRSPHHRDDLRFYALLQTLRQAVPPRKLVTYYLDYSTSDVEDVTDGVLQSALRRALDGIERHVELTVEGREPVKKVGVACRWCPLQETCAEGRAYLHGDDDDIEP